MDIENLIGRIEDLRDEVRDVANTALGLYEDAQQAMDKDYFDIKEHLKDDYLFSELQDIMQTLDIVANNLNDAIKYC